MDAILYNKVETEADRIIRAINQAGGDWAEGTLTISENTTVATFAHGLSKTPFMAIIYIPDTTPSGGTSPSSLRSIVMCVQAAQAENLNMIGSYGYNSSGTRAALTPTASFTATDVTFTSNSSAYTFKAGMTYIWRAYT